MLISILILVVLALIWALACAHDKHKEDEELARELRRIARREENKNA